MMYALTHLGRVTHICVSRLTITGSDNGLSPGRRQAIIWTNAEILLIGPLGTKFSENSIEILTFSFTKMRLKVSSAQWRPFSLGLNVLIKQSQALQICSIADSGQIPGAIYFTLLLSGELLPLVENLGKRSGIRSTCTQDMTTYS